MKYRWLKIGVIIWGTNDLKVDDLVALKNKQYDAIIDTEEGTYYDADENDWLKIEGNK